MGRSKELNLIKKLCLCKLTLGSLTGGLAGYSICYTWLAHQRQAELEKLIEELPTLKKAVKDLTKKITGLTDAYNTVLLTNQNLERANKLQDAVLTSKIEEITKLIDQLAHKEKTINTLTKALDKLLADKNNINSKNNQLKVEIDELKKKLKAAQNNFKFTWDRLVLVGDYLKSKGLDLFKEPSFKALIPTST